MGVNMSLDIKVIRESFEVTKPIAGEVATKFYELLFVDYPDSRALFEKVDMEKQKVQLMGGLTKIVDTLDKPEALTKYLKASGVRHIKYGVQEEHYPWVGGTLIKTFAHFFGDAWTAELQDQWILAYDFISETMIAGALEFTPKKTELKDKVKTICQGLIEEEMNNVINDEVKQKIRAMLRKEIFTLLEEEFQELKAS